MKHIIYVLLIVFFTFACNNTEKEDSAEASTVENTAEEDIETMKEGEAPSEQAKAIIEFENKEFNFGEIQEGDVVKHSFKFKNTGEVP